MRIPILFLSLAIPANLSAQAIQPGEWTGKVTVRELVVPGAPGFLLSMAKGKSRTEKKCVPPALAAQGAVALLSPDPKAKCTVEQQRLNGGRYEQILSCPQKKAGPMKVTRQGSYDANGLTGNVVMTGPTAKGTMRFAGDQSVRRTKATCKG